MLPTSHRLHRSADFAAVVRRGARKGRRTVVVHVLEDTSPVRTGGPRFGLIVSKAVGDAVTRHRVSRRLRHICQAVLSESTAELEAADVVELTLPDSTLVVLRALPAAAAATSEELAADVRSGLRAATRLARERHGPTAGEGSPRRGGETR